MWVIPKEQDGDFVAAMEDVLDVYERPYDEKRPVVCFDEQPRQLIGEKLLPIPAEPGQVERYDCQYERNGTVDNFMFVQPLWATGGVFRCENERRSWTLRKRLPIY